MPFDFLKRKKDEPTAAAEPQPVPTAPPGRGILFLAVTEEWRLNGRMDVDGRLSDVLNKRESVPIDDVRWAPVDGSGPMTEAPADGCGSAGPKAGVHPLDAIFAASPSNSPRRMSSRFLRSWMSRIVTTSPSIVGSARRFVPMTSAKNICPSRRFRRHSAGAEEPGRAAVSAASARARGTSSGCTSATSFVPASSSGW